MKQYESGFTVIAGMLVLALAVSISYIAYVRISTDETADNNVLSIDSYDEKSDDTENSTDRGTETSNTIIDTLKSYTSTNNSLTISYPQDWSMTDDSDGHLLVTSSDFAQGPPGEGVGAPEYIEGQSIRIYKTSYGDVNDGLFDKDVRTADEFIANISTPDTLFGINEESVVDISSGEVQAVKYLLEYEGASWRVIVLGTNAAYTASLNGFTYYDSSEEDTTVLEAIALSIEEQ